MGKDENLQLSTYQLLLELAKSWNQLDAGIVALQKSKYFTDIERFRNYLGMSYLSKYPTYRDINDGMDVVSEPQSKYHGHPIITIYILGYKI